MTFGSGCLLAIGILFVLCGGCTALVWIGPPSHELGDMSGLAAIGGVILLIGAAAVAGAIYMIKQRNAAQRAGLPQGDPIPPEAP